MKGDGVETQRLVILAMVFAAVGVLLPNVNGQQVTMQVDASRRAHRSRKTCTASSLIADQHVRGRVVGDYSGDRKFLYPVNSSATQTPPNSRTFVGRWRPSVPMLTW